MYDINVRLFKFWTLKQTTELLADNETKCLRCSREWKCKQAKFAGSSVKQLIKIWRVFYNAP